MTPKIFETTINEKNCQIDKLENDLKNVINKE